MIRRLFGSINGQIQQDTKSKLRRKLMLHEAKVGGKLFGPIPEGRNREFFCLDETTWVWHEEWKENGQAKVITTRYDIRPDRILKSQNGHHYQGLSQEEEIRLIEATTLYQAAVRKEVYSFV